MDRAGNGLTGVALAFATAAALATACGGQVALELPDAAIDAEIDAPEDAAPPDAIPADASTDGGSDATVDAPIDAPREAPPPDASGDCADACAPPVVGAPRPIAPLSTATATSQQPTLHWQLASASDGAEVEICHDRACTKPVVTFLAPGTSGRPPAPLAAGVYFWRLHGTSNGGVGMATSPTWEMFVGALSAPVDTSWGSVPDVDGDGIADALTGTPGVVDAGTIYLYKGGPTPLAAVATLDRPPGGPAPDDYGRFLASAGDIDGDGFPEVLDNTSYELWMYRGGAAGLSTQAMLVTPAAPSQRVESAAGVGDVDGDGYGDVAVGVNVNPMTGGIVAIYRGSATGLSASPTQLAIGDWGFGFWLAPTDINGDGYGDLVTAGTQGLYVFEGGPGGPRNTPVVIPFPLYASNGYFVSSAGDVNGDGYGDVLSIETFYPSSTPEALLYFGSAAGPGTQPLVTTSLGGYDQGIGAAGGVGDVNGDGYADYALTSAYGGTDLYLALGGGSGPALVSHAWPLPMASGATVSFAAAGDVNGDGVDDLIVGDPGKNVSQVYLGDRTSDLPAMPSQTLTGGGSPL